MKNVEISIDPEDVLKEIEIDDIIEYYGFDDILSEIPENEIIKYYAVDDLLDHIDTEVIKDYMENNS